MRSMDPENYPTDGGMSYNNEFHNVNASFRIMYQGEARA